MSDELALAALRAAARQAGPCPAPSRSPDGTTATPLPGGTDHAPAVAA